MLINRAGHSYARPQISFGVLRVFHAGVRLSARKRDQDGTASLLQLPHFSAENVNPVAKKCKSVSALLKLSEDVIKLLRGQFSGDQGVSALGLIPSDDVRLALTVDGEQEILGAISSRLI